MKEKSSEYKEKARKEGMIRPFLLLVSMPPIMRNKLANLVGISLLAESFFGDPHHEAFHVITSVQNHCQQFYEKILNKIGKRCNWFDVLRRTIDNVLKKNPIIKCDDWNKTYEECLTPHSKLIPLIEKEFLLKLADHCDQKNFFPQEKTEEEVESDEFTLRFILSTLSNVNTEKILKYYVHVLKYYTKFNLNLFESKSDDVDFQSSSENPAKDVLALPKSESRAKDLLWYDEKLTGSFPKFHSIETSDGKNLFIIIYLYLFYLFIFIYFFIFIFRIRFFFWK